MPHCHSFLKLSDELGRTVCDDNLFVEVFGLSLSMLHHYPIRLELGNHIVTERILETTWLA